MKILFIGDIIGKLGRLVTKQVLPDLKQVYQPDFILANGENSAHGYGITEKIYKELISTGIDGLSMGNHMWDKKELAKNLEKFPLIVRPANYPPSVPGQDYLIMEKNGLKLALTNLLGRTFMPPMDCPFQAIEKLLEKIKTETKNIIVDVHAEATSEKGALGWYLDGKVSAMVGTHTHVMTADEQILPQGTAFLTDIGMAGAQDSIIGMNKEQILKRFVTQMPEKFAPTEEGPAIFNAVLIELDPESGKAKKLERIQRFLEEK